MINDMIVGMENLPNVFIDKIQVFPSSIGIRVVLMLCMYDHKENPSWHGRNLDIKLKVLFESRQNEINALNNGDLSLHDVAPEVLPIETFGRVMIKDSASGTPTLMQGDYEKYTFVFERNLNRNEDLNVYAACFVDNTGFETHPVFSKYYGPMVAEQVFVGGQLNTLSNYFYYPDTNKEYGGPVHIKPDGSYMEGSVHSEEPHKDVRIVSEENYKIQAFNVDLLDEGFADSNLSVRLDDLSDVDVVTGLSAIDPLYAASTSPRALTTPAELGLTPTGIDDASTRVQAPDFNLAPTSTPIQPPPGY